MDLHRSIIGLAAAALLVPLGCQSSTSSGTEYVITAKRELRTTVGADIGTVHDTAVDVVENELLYTIDNQARDAREGIINARTARGHAVRIETFRHGEQLTQIEVYVGPLGDETAERDVYEAIESRLRDGGWLSATPAAPEAVVEAEPAEADK
ncbi:MAG: DUF3568 family protein [Planctomycetota bacterium]|jgi:hypothetical protein